MLDQPLGRASARGHLPFLLCIALIGLATLGRGDIPAYTTYPLDPYCVICGWHGSADAALNLLLFVPLGFFGARSLRPWVAVLAGLVLSGSIEIAQASIPGRFPTVGDVVWNSAGTALGLALRHARSTFPAWPRRWRLGAAGATITLATLPTLLMGPRFTPETYFAQAAPLVSSARSYEGEVSRAEIAGIDLPRGVVAHTADVREALRQGAPLRVIFGLARPPERLAHIFRFVDSRTDEIAALGIRGTDLVWTQRMLATALAFETPSVSWTRALDGVSLGSEVSVLVRKEHGSVCMQSAGRERCGLRPTVGDGWQLLLSEPGRPLARQAIWLLWLGFPGMLAGAMAGGAILPTLGLATFGAGLAAATAILPGVGFSGADVAALVGTILAGFLLARLTRGTRSHA